VLRVPRIPLALLALSGVLVGGCSDKEPSPVPQSPATKPGRSVATSALGQDRAATLAALALPQAYLSDKLGAHELKITSLLVTRLHKKETSKVEQSLSLRVDNKGAYAAVKNTDPQYGNEVIWTPPMLHAKLRYSKFTRRRATDSEAEAVAERLYGYLPAYVGLLGRFIAVEAAGKATHLGREAIRVKLKPRKSPTAIGAGASAPGKGWRRTIAVKTLEGNVLFDARTGVPLKATLKATWSFNPPKGAPPRSGIPKVVDSTTVGSMSLTFKQQLEALGAKVAQVDPPPDEAIVKVERRRLEIERQMLLGERPMPKHQQAARSKVTHPKATSPKGQGQGKGK
jgi:hypothetical protein